MVDSPYKVYSVYKRIPFIFDEYNFDMVYRIFEPVGLHWYNNSTKYIKTHCKRIYNEIESFHYTYNEMASLMVYQTIIGKDIDLASINNIEMNKLREILSKNTIREDEKKLETINNEVGLSGIQEYFKINEDGESLIYSLIKKGVISVYFFINYYDKILTKVDKNILFMFKGSKKYHSFIHKTKLIKKFNISTIQGVSNE
jgi:hypothetical protein